MPRLFPLNRYENIYVNDEEVCTIVDAHVVAEVKPSRRSRDEG